MEKDPEQKDATKSPAYRWVTAGFGVFAITIAVVIPITSDLTIGPLVASAVIGIFGVDAIISAYRNSPCLLSRIGPLP